MPAPKFSIGLPVVKTKYFREALESILAQSYENFEIIIVDNKADTPIGPLLALYPDNRIRLYKNEQQLPMIKNWNHVLSYACGEFFILFSDDDIAGPNYLKSIAQIIDAHGDMVDAVVVRRADIDEAGKIKSIKPQRGEWESAYELICNNYFENCSTVISDFATRTSTLRRAGGFIEIDLGHGSDWLTLFSCSIKNGAFFAKGIHFYYRTSPISVTATGNGLRKALAWRDQQSKLANILPPSSDDNIYAAGITQKLDTYFTQHIISDLSSFIEHNPLRIISTFRFRKKLRLSPRQIIKAFALGTLRKFSH